jgi:MFS family permease
MLSDASSKTFYRQSPHSYVVILGIAYMLSFMDRQILSLMVEPIRRDFGISDLQVALLQGIAFAALYAVSSLPAAYLADRWSRTKLIAGAIWLWSVMTFACGLARTYPILWIARGGVGVGESVLSPATYSLLADVYPARKLPRALAVFTMGGIIGGGLSYVLGGFIVGYASDGDAVTFLGIGVVQPWQAVFMLAGLPGILVGLLVLFLPEPPRRGIATGAEGDAGPSVPLSSALVFVRARWKAYAGIIAGASVLSIFGYAFLSWYPTLLIRIHGLAASSAGVKLGVLYLSIGPLGAYSGARLVEELRDRGYADACPRALLLIALSLIPLSCGLLSTNEAMALMASAPLILVLGSWLGVAASALQLITPNQMRGQVSALFHIFVNLIGLGVGPVAVALLTGHLFRADESIDKSLALTIAACGATGACLFACSLRHYRILHTQASAWLHR